MVFCFIVDTSLPHSSTSADTSITHLDTVKCAVEQFLTTYPMGSGRLPIENSLLLVQTGADGTSLLCPLHRDQRTFDMALKNIIPSSTAPDATVDLSAAFRFTCNLLNKYRTAGNIGNIGRGRLPWSIQPTIIILLTHPDSLFAESNQSLLRHMLHEREDGQMLLEDPNCLRWDDRFFILSMGPPQPPAVADAVRVVCHSVGGELMQCHDWKSAISAAKNLAVTVSHPSVIVDIVRSSSGGVKQRRVLMTVRGVGAWPLPDDFWIHRNLDTLPSRRPYPILNIRLHRSRTSISDLLNQCGSLAVPVDRYDITFLHEMENPANMWYGVYVVGSAREGTAEDEAPLCGAYNPLQDSLCILPYDYPTLLPLLHKAKIGSVTSQWMADMDAYMNRIPLYYHASILQLLRKLKLAPPNLPPPTVDTFLSKNVQRRVSRHQSNAHADIQMIEAQVPVVTHSTTAPYPPLEELLHIWDRMRGCIYGGEGLTTMGLYLKDRCRNSGGGYVSNNPKKDVEEDWFYRAVGASKYPQVEIRNMGDYTRVLTSREVHRDPENLNPPPDEGTPQELIRSSTKPPKGKRGKRSVLRLEGDEQETETIVEDEVEFEQDYEDEATLAFESSVASSPTRSSSSDSLASLTSLSSNSSSSSSGSSTIVLGESRAKKKARLQQQQQEQKQENATQSTVAAETSAEPELPPGWIKRFSDKHKCDYWFNTTSGKSQWEPPVSR